MNQHSRKSIQFEMEFLHNINILFSFMSSDDFYVCL